MRRKVMESKLRYKYVIISFWSLVGFFIGGSVYVINGGDSNVVGFFAKAVGSLIGHTVSSKIIFKRNPHLKLLDKRLSNDERNREIIAEASTYSFLGTLVLVIGVILLGELRGDFYLSFVAAVFGGIMLLMNFVSTFVLSKLR
jgi:hypothetical protein